MKRFKNILLVCNFDAKQHMAMERAVSLAKQNEARLTVLTVVKELPADTRMTITGMPPGKLLDRVIDDHRTKVDALAAAMGRQGIGARSGELRYTANGTLVAAHGCVTTPCNRTTITRRCALPCTATSVPFTVFN